MDILHQFIKSECFIDQNVRTNASQIYNAYQKWAENNFPYTMSETKFGLELKKSFTRIHSKNGNVYLGIGLKQRGYSYQQNRGTRDSI